MGSNGKAASERRSDWLTREGLDEAFDQGLTDAWEIARFVPVGLLIEFDYILHLQERTWADDL